MDRQVTQRPAAVGTASRLEATHVRLVLLLAAICFLAHFNRVSIAVAADSHLMKQFEISPTNMGAVYTAFLAAYTLMMIPGGYLIDWRGPRFALAVVCLGSAGLVALTGAVGWLAISGGAAWFALLGIRATMGALSAPLHPAAARGVSLGIPVMRRSGANGIVTGAALLGVAATYVVFGWLIDQIGWPSAFIAAAATTFGLGVLWLASTRNNLAQQGTAAEGSTKVRTVSRSVSQGAVGQSPLAWLGRHKNLILLTLSYAAVGYFQYLFFYWIHYYFETVLNLGSDASRVYATYPALAMAVAMPLGGWLSDLLQGRYGRHVSRAYLAMASMSTSAALLVLGTMVTETFWIVTLLSLALGILGLAEGPFWVTAVEVGGRAGGRSAGIFNTGGNAGGIVSPWITPWISDTLGLGWQAGIGLGAAVGLAGGALWYWIDLGPDGSDLGEAAPYDGVQTAEVSTTS